MKKILLLLCLASPVFAGGPKYSFDQPQLNDEMNNIYKDIGNVLKASPVRISSAIISAVTVSTLNWIVPEGTNARGERCFPEVQFTIATTSTSASPNYVRTGLEGTVTPHSASSYFKLRMWGSMLNGNQIYMSLARCTGCSPDSHVGTQLLPANGGTNYIPSAGTATVPVSLGWDDNPTTLTSILYQVTMLPNGISASFCTNGNTCVLTIQECF